MGKFTALIAIVLAFLVVPALAAAAPTGTQITSPSGQTFVNSDADNPGSLHVAGTTSGGTGDVDLRCYYGGNHPLIASGIAVANGAFSTDVPLTQALFNTFGNPHPFCMLRAVPTGTIPSAPPDLPSTWQGAMVGFGEHDDHNLGAGFGATPPDTNYDYVASQAQSKAFNDYYSVGSCGLCDSYLFVSGSLAPSNPIWWGDWALYANPRGVTTRTGVQIDGANAYSAAGAWWNGQNQSLADNPGFPAVSDSHSVSSVNGDLSIDEHSSYGVCAEDRLAFPPTDSSCASFAASGVQLDRSIRQTQNGQLVTIVDHWKSVDGKPHDLDLIYEDSEYSQNAGIAGREGRLNFPWTGGGFRTYAPNTQIPVPPSMPASVLVKTDASTGIGGDGMNPYGAMTLSSQPTQLEVVKVGDASQIGYWHTRYQRTVPAGGEITLAAAYTDDLGFPTLDLLRQKAETAVAAPSISIDSPGDGSTVDAGSAHVTGTASSSDGQVSVEVNGVAAAVGSDGHWSADVPLTDGANRILAVASNKIGVGSNAIVSVTKPAAAPAAPAAAAPVAAVAKPVHCVVPKLKGKTLAKAKRLLKQAHCRLGKVVRQASKRVKAGHVLKTRFKAGTRHPAGTRIRVTVARRG